MKWRGGDARGAKRRDGVSSRWHCPHFFREPHDASCRQQRAASRRHTRRVDCASELTRTAPPRGGGGHSLGRVPAPRSPARLSGHRARVAPGGTRLGRRRARPGTVVSPPRASVNNRGCSPVFRLLLRSPGAVVRARRRSPDRSGAPGGTRGPSSAATATRYAPPPRRVGRRRRTRAPRSAVAVVPSHPKSSSRELRIIFRFAPRSRSRSRHGFLHALQAVARLAGGRPRRSGGRVRDGRRPHREPPRRRRGERRRPSRRRRRVADGRRPQPPPAHGGAAPRRPQGHSEGHGREDDRRPGPGRLRRPAVGFGARGRLGDELQSSE